MKLKTIRPLLWIFALPIFAALFTGIGAAEGDMSNQPTFSADNHGFKYVGRIDFTNPKLPRFWSPGVYISANFTGTYCNVLLNDQVLWGNSHNFIEIVVDGVAKRYQLTGPTNFIKAADGLPDAKHSIVICKDT